MCLRNKFLLITTLVIHRFYFCYFWTFDNLDIRDSMKGIPRGADSLSKGSSRKNVCSLAWARAKEAEKERGGHSAEGEGAGSPGA